MSFHTCRFPLLADMSVRSTRRHQTLSLRLIVCASSPAPFLPIFAQRWTTSRWLPPTPWVGSWPWTEKCRAQLGAQRASCPPPRLCSPGARQVRLHRGAFAPHSLGTWNWAKSMPSGTTSPPRLAVPEYNQKALLRKRRWKEQGRNRIIQNSFQLEKF